jgi:hypothetical protein
MGNLPKPCLDCGRLSPNSRCAECQAIRSRKQDLARGPRPHYAGDYRKRAKAVREAPGPCWLCGEGEKINDLWQADHVVPGDPNSLLAKAHRSCNIRRGGGTQARSGV